MRKIIQKLMGDSSSTSHMGPHPGLVSGPVAARRGRGKVRKGAADDGVVMFSAGEGKEGC